MLYDGQAAQIACGALPSSANGEARQVSSLHSTFKIIMVGISNVWSIIGAVWQRRAV